MAVRLRIADARGHRIAAPRAIASRQRCCQCLHSEARIRSKVMTRDLLALADADRIDIDLQHLCLRPELPAAAGVERERAAHRDDEIRILQVLEADFRREAARDADAEGIVVEEAPRR